MNTQDMYPKRAKQGKVLTVVIVIVALVAAIGVGYAAYQWHRGQVTGLEQQVNFLNGQLSEAEQQGSLTPGEDVVEYTSENGVKLKVYVPKESTKESPLIVLGLAPGNWSFEASFPAILRNSEGDNVAQGTAQIIGDWMTEDLVPFSIEIEYDEDELSGTGTLVLQKDNPSGMPQNDDSVTIPVQF